MTHRVLFLDTVHPILKDSLEKDGIECHENYKCSREQLLKIIANYSGLVIRSRFVLDKEILDTAINLKFIARSGSGMENIDVEYAKIKGIKCFNSPEGNRDAVGEHCVGMLLTLLNKIHTGDQEVRQGLWQREENRGTEIGGKTIGIVGYGNTGSALAQKISGFGCKVLATDKFISGFGSSLAQETSLQEIQKEADIVSIHIPFNEENKYFINEDFFSAFSKNIYFINTSRGGILQTSALVNAIQRGKVLGACLDVLEYEMKTLDMDFTSIPEDLKYLLNSDKTLLTPHVAGWTDESYEKLSSVLYRKIKNEFID